MNASRGVGLLVLLAAGGWAAGGPEVAPAPHAAVPEFVSEDWKFAAKFPGKPKKQVQAVVGFAMTAFGVESKDGMCGVAVADLPLPDGETAAQIQDRLDGARDGAVRNVNGTLASSKPITLGARKHPGREYVATITRPKDGQVRARTYLVGKRLYQVMVMGTDAYATSPEATAFLDSFRVTE